MAPIQPRRLMPKCCDAATLEADLDAFTVQR
jgi:hypothetical protein